MQSFESYLERFKKNLADIFEKHYLTEGSKRGFPNEMFQEIMAHNPLSAFIPETYGGKAQTAERGLKVLEAASYQSLSLSLIMGINGALFIQPVARYADPDLRKRIFERFLNEKAMGGLMITEPNFGSDALKMQTSYQALGDGNVRVQGVKHWGGLTGRADFWLLTARKKTPKGELVRDIDFFVYDHETKGIEVEEYFKSLGLYLIPYGRNNIDAVIPEDNKLQPKSSGIKMMLDVLHRSRTQFPGMAMGFLHRIMDEAMEHCKTRMVGGVSLFNYDQVKKRLSDLQAAFTVCSAMCHFGSQRAALENDLSGDDITSNSIKSVVTDLMQDASQSLLQLVGAKGYSLDHIAGRSIVDSRPFQIFEGSNDILYQQISESVLKGMRKLKQNNLADYLSSISITDKAADVLRSALDFQVDWKLAQHKLVSLGKVLSRVVSMQFVLNLQESGFNGELIKGAVQHLSEEIERNLASFQKSVSPLIVEDYHLDSNWANFIQKGA